MKIRKLLFVALLLISTLGVNANNSVIWQGTQRFSGWSDVLNIDGSNFSNAKADDVLLFSITASSGAQLQISYGSGWTNFDGLECLDIKGDYQMVLSSQTLQQVQQGIHIKGKNFTLTAVTIVSNDGEYTTESADLFAWDRLLTSGATRGQSCTVGFKAYGGAGWSWPETVNLTEYSCVIIELLQPAPEAMTAQLLFGETGVRQQNFVKGAKKCKVPIGKNCTDVWSLNLITDKEQTVTIASVNLVDKQGNIVPSGVESIAANARIVSVEYYSLDGRRLAQPQPGINIVKTVLEGGRSTVRKINIER